MVDCVQLADFDEGHTALTPNIGCHRGCSLAIIFPVLGYTPFASLGINIYAASICPLTTVFNSQVTHPKIRIIVVEAHIERYQIATRSLSTFSLLSSSSLLLSFNRV